MSSIEPWATNPEREAAEGEALKRRLEQLAARLDRLATQGPELPERMRRRQGQPDPYDTVVASEDIAAEAGIVPPPPDNAAIEETARDEAMAAIAAALHDLDRQGPQADFDPPPAEEPEVFRPAAEARLHAIRERIEGLKKRHPAPESVAGLERSLGRLRERLETMGREEPEPALDEHLDYRDHPTSPPLSPLPLLDLQAAIAEIGARQRAIDVPPPEPPAWSPPPPRGAPAASAPAFGDAEVIRAEIADLSRTLDAAEAAARGRADTVSDRLAGIEMLIEATARESSAGAVEAGISEILARLDRLSAESDGGRLETVAQQIFNRLPPAGRLDALTAEIDRLSERMAGDGAIGDFGRIEQRLGSMTSQIAALVAEQTRPLAETTNRLEVELGGLRDTVEGLYRLSHESGSGSINRLEQRIAAIAGQLESSLRDAPRADVAADLFGRLGRIADHFERNPGSAAAAAAPDAFAAEIAGLRQSLFDRERTEFSRLEEMIQSLAERLDAAAGTGGNGAAMAVLEERIATLSRRLDSVAGGPPGEERQAQIVELSTQVRALSERLDALHSGEAMPQGMASLAAQVDAVVERLEAMPAGPVPLDSVAANLARLEEMVHDTRRESLEAVQAAARDAVRDLSGLAAPQSADAALVEALKADLRELQAASENTDRRTTDTLGAVHETLDRIVRRLSRLEDDLRTAPAAPREPAMGSPAAAAPAVTAPPTTTVPEPQADAAWNRIGADHPEDRPLKPGSGRPVQSEEDAERDRKADFIAAARRAAQAAAAEHAAIGRRSFDEPEDEDDTDAEGRDSALARFGRRFRGRRTLLIAAGAVVLAIAVIQVLQPFSRGDQTSPATEEAAPEPVLDMPPPPPRNGDAAVDAIAPEIPEEEALSPLSIEDDPPVELIAPSAGAGMLSSEGASPSAFAPSANGPDRADAAEAFAEPAPLIYPMPPETAGSDLLRQAAAEGDSAALFEVASRYAEGRGVGRDLAEAAVWYERAGERGLAMAQFQLGSLHERGQGVAQDRDEAAAWYQIAAEQGNIQAMHNLGVLLSASEGAAGLAEAIRWFTEAGERGVRDSQYNLGVIYARGIGVTQDLPASYLWFALAAAQGDADAAQRRDDVAAALSEEQLAAARAAVSAWTLTEADVEANSVPVPEGGWGDTAEGAAVYDRTELVRLIQELLADEGFDPGPADGVEGPRTRDAIRAFQATIGAEVTGEIDLPLLEALRGSA
ncbi:MAG: SEL1-like repeat protein [Bauldia sp.]|nr:SEL1-like repeat protein [Bauldia sp.]